MYLGIDLGTSELKLVLLGDDTDAVLSEFGYSPQDITALRGKGVVA